MTHSVTFGPSTNAIEQPPEQEHDVLVMYGTLLGAFADELRSNEFNPYQGWPRLFLKSFNPAFQLRFWKHAATFIKVPNALVQDLPCGSKILRMLSAFDDRTLLGIAECSTINLRRMLRRSVWGWMPKLATIFLATLALAKEIKERFGLELQVPPWVVGELLPSWALGFVLGALVNMILSAPALGLARAFNDLIAIAMARRQLKKAE